MPAAPMPIEIKVEGIAHLFDNFDPFPFRERDLDKNAEDYIVGWAREISRNEPIEIVIHVSGTGTDAFIPEDVKSAIQKHFSYQAQATRNDLSELFRVGRWSLVVGILVLAICVLLREISLTHFKQEGVGRFLSEGLLILGSVANWRPLEIFLYDWWPLLRRRNLYTRLSQANVVVTTDESVRSPIGDSSNITFIEKNGTR